MPRLNALSDEQRATCVCMRELRQTLKIPRTAFAALIGVNGARVLNRERLLSPWKSSELIRVKRSIEKHHADANRAFEVAFGQPPFAS